MSLKKGAKNAIAMSLVLGLCNSAFAVGILTSMTQVSVEVQNSVQITKQLKPFIIDVDMLDNKISKASNYFVVRANSLSTQYDVWVSVDPNNLDSKNKIYLARNGRYAVPLKVTLYGNDGINKVRTNPAALQIGAAQTARPLTGIRMDGHGVAGSNLYNGTQYTVKLEEIEHLTADYPDVPRGTYSINITSHVALHE